MVSNFELTKQFWNYPFHHDMLTMKGSILALSMGFFLMFQRCSWYTVSFISLMDSVLLESVLGAFEAIIELGP